MSYVEENLGYETHITLSEEYVNYPFELKGWKFSKIDGDPILGDGVKCYLTSHDKEYGNAVHKLYNAVVNLQSSCGVDGIFNVRILRVKIEKIVKDWKITDSTSDFDDVIYNQMIDKILEAGV